MAKRRSRKRDARVTPDDHFRVGPIEFARFGRLTIAQSHLTEGEFAALQERLVSRYPQIVLEIDGLVTQLAELVSVVPAGELLKRAWWQLAATHIGVQSEASVGREQTHALRMVDYIQSLIASVPPSPVRRSELTEEQWETLGRLVSTLFDKLNLDYQLCRTAKNREENPSLDMALEEFRYKAEMFWCNVRGKRYQTQELRALNDILAPHSGVLQMLFGITATDLVRELAKVQRSLTFGAQEAFGALFELRDKTLGPSLQRAREEDPNTEVARVISKALADEGLRARAEAAIGKLYGLDLFDLEKTTSLPRSLLEELSWSEGQDTEFFAEGDHRGWPLRVWPVFKRPFIKLDGRYYCFDLFSLFDNFYRVVQRVILRLKPDYRDEWNKLQKEVSERLPFDYLAKLLPGARVYCPVYYRTQSGSGGTRQWHEADGLLVFCDHLFVVEVKAGSFTYTSPATDLPAHINSLKALVLSPADQGRRFVEYLESEDEVSIFDEAHRSLGTLRRRDFRHVTICAVTLDAFTELAAQAQHLRQIGVNVGDRPLWSLSIDDLRVYADTFDNPLAFLHFVEQRMKAAASSLVELHDELDHLGLYLEHNNYAQHASEIRDGKGSAGQLNFVGYRARVDTYFDAVYKGEKAPRPLKQDVPRRISELLDFLAASSSPLRAELASLLLDMAGDTRRAVAEGIDSRLRRTSESEIPSPLSTHGEVRLTVLCWTPAVGRDEAGAVAHARTVMLVRDEPDRVLLELTYSAEGTIQAVHWQRVGLTGLSAMELAALQEGAARLRTARLARAERAQGKIGRNTPCPCGSGQKYKKCCLP